METSDPLPVPEGFQIFESEEFGQVRVVTGEDGEPRFVAKDVAETLGYKKPENAITRHCRAQTTAPKQGGGSLTIIPERDVYRLVMRSNLPEAEKFEEWVVGDILPTIRRHGIYATDDVIEKTFTDPDSIIQIMERLKKERAEKARIASERDEAVRTKAHISDKKTATAMSTAAVCKKAVTANQKRAGVFSLPFLLFRATERIARHRPCLCIQARFR